MSSSERRFIRELATPVDLEAELTRAADYQQLQLSCREFDAALTNFVANMRTDVDDR